MIGFCGSGNVWTGNIDECAELFDGLVQLFCDKIATTLQRSPLVAYFAHTILLNIFVRKKEWWIDQRHTLVEFQPVF